MSVVIDPRREAPEATFMQKRQPWVARRACDRPGDWALFYAEDIAPARAICENCPVRKECGQQAMTEEQGLPTGHRFGVRAFMTPEQRESIERRGGLRPHQDPMLLVLGRDGRRRVPPVPDEGDRWSRHHTTLARKVVTWLTENVAVGKPLPTQTKMCELLGCNPAPLRRVMEALVQDGTLDFAGSKTGTRGANGATVAYVRRSTPHAIGSWVPTHMRSNQHEGVPSD